MSTWVFLANWPTPPPFTVAVGSSTFLKSAIMCGCWVLLLLLLLMMMMMMWCSYGAAHATRNQSNAKISNNTLQCLNLVDFACLLDEVFDIPIQVSCTAVITHHFFTSWNPIFRDHFKEVHALQQQTYWSIIDLYRKSMVSMVSWLRYLVFSIMAGLKTALRHSWVRHFSAAPHICNSFTSVKPRTTKKVQIGCVGLMVNRRFGARCFGFLGSFLKNL